MLSGLTMEQIHPNFLLCFHSYMMWLRKHLLKKYKNIVALRQNSCELAIDSVAKWLARWTLNPRMAYHRCEFEPCLLFP